MFKFLQNLRIGPSFPGGLNQVSQAPLIGFTPSRSTYILKRRYPVKLLKKGRERVTFKAKNYIYDLEENTEILKQKKIQVILKTAIEGLGNEGDCVTLSRNFAYNHLLLPGLADYGTPEAIEALKKLNKDKDKEKKYSSAIAPLTVKYLSRQVLGVVMNQETKWTLEPWHIRVSFRKAGIILPESAITLPEKKITGPDLNLEGKDFIVTVTINNREKAPVRCRIHHWSTSAIDRLPYVKYPWCLESEPIFEEDAPILQNLPLPNFFKAETA